MLLKPFSKPFHKYCVWRPAEIRKWFSDGPVSFCKIHPKNETQNHRRVDRSNPVSGEEKERKQIGRQENIGVNRGAARES